ncbi:MAG: hypothetical protein V1676_00465 [Candidatus Diapherotrites archaeon]
MNYVNKRYSDRAANNGTFAYSRGAPKCMNCGNELAEQSGSLYAHRFCSPRCRDMYISGD